MSGWCYNRFIFIGSEPDIDAIDRSQFMLPHLFPETIGHDTYMNWDVEKDPGPIDIDRENVKINNKMYQRVIGNYESSRPSLKIVQAIRSKFPGIFRMKLEYIDPISNIIGVWTLFKGNENDERFHYVGTQDCNKITRQIQHSLYLDYEPFINVMARLHKQ